MEPVFKPVESLRLPWQGGEALIPLTHERESLLELVGISRQRVRDEDGVGDNDPRGFLFALMRTRHDYGDKLISYNERKRFMSEASLQHLDRMIVVHSETISHDSLQVGPELNLGLLYDAAAEFRGLKHDLGALPEQWQVAYDDVQMLERSQTEEVEL